MDDKNKKEDIHLTFSLTLKEANVIFKALGSRPFDEVYELIGKLNEQANNQLRNDLKNKD